MTDRISWIDRFWTWLAWRLPRRLCDRCATRFWAAAYNHITDEQSDTFLDVLHIGHQNWNQEAPDHD